MGRAHNKKFGKAEKSFGVKSVMDELLFNYDEEFNYDKVNSFVKESLTCSICYGLIWDNVQCCNCLTLYCCDCLDNYFDTIEQVAEDTEQDFEPKCPFCRAESSFEKNKFVDKILGQIYIECKKCSKKILRANIEDHLDICLGKKMNCCLCNFEGREKAHKCTFIDCHKCDSPIHNDLDSIKNHEEVCPMSSVECLDCGIELLRRELKYHQSNYCPEKVMICKHCFSQYKKKDELEHFKKCSQLEYECSLCKKTYNRNGTPHKCNYIICNYCFQPFKKTEITKHYISCDTNPNNAIELEAPIDLEEDH